MQTFAKYRSEYGSFHTKRFTFLTHLLGVPLIILAVQIFFSWFRFTIFIDLSLAWTLWFLLSLFYLYLAGMTSVSTILVLFILTACAQYVATPTANTYSIIFALVSFLLGVFFQWWGHFYEGKKPAFMDNLIHMIIAPLFLVTEVQALFLK